MSLPGYRVSLCLKLGSGLDSFRWHAVAVSWTIDFAAATIDPQDSGNSRAYGPEIAIAALKLQFWPCKHEGFLNSWMVLYDS